MIVRVPPSTSSFGGPERVVGRVEQRVPKGFIYLDIRTRMDSLGRKPVGLRLCNDLLRVRDLFVSWFHVRWAHRVPVTATIEAHTTT